tara:strand:+ start:434 stop:538 length:105 start_codon:yes stop_codon:yes gene_type:complete
MSVLLKKVQKMGLDNFFSMPAFDDLILTILPKSV